MPVDEATAIRCRFCGETKIGISKYAWVMISEAGSVSDACCLDCRGSATADECELECQKRVAQEQSK